MANVVASTHPQAPLDHELLNIGEPPRPLEFRTRPLHVMSRWRPIWRQNLVAVQERRRAARTASSTAGSASWAGPPNEANTPPGSSSAAMRGHRPSGFVQCSAAAA